MSRRSVYGANPMAQTLVAPERDSDTSTATLQVTPANTVWRGAKPIRPGNAVSADKVLRAFNTWAFKREQPSDPDLMLRLVAKAIASHTPIPFVLYWGKGPRHEVGSPENECLDFLSAMTARVQTVYSLGAKLTLILTDTHARLNGHAENDVERYFSSVRSLSAPRGIETCSLGSLIQSSANLAPATPLKETLPSEIMSSLIGSAEKWYRGPGTPQEGALAYLRLNLIERRVVEQTFPNSIFVTFNGSDLRSLFPTALPIFYMYSLRRGTSVKPWFLAEQPRAGRWI